MKSRNNEKPQNNIFTDKNTRKTKAFMFHRKYQILLQFAKFPKTCTLSRQAFVLKKYSFDDAHCDCFCNKRELDDNFSNHKNTQNSSENVHRSILTVFATQFFFISTNLNFFRFVWCCVPFKLFSFSLLTRLFPFSAWYRCIRQPIWAVLMNLFVRECLFGIEARDAGKWWLWLLQLRSETLVTVNRSHRCFIASACNFLPRQNERRVWESRLKEKCGSFVTKWVNN